MHQPRPSDDALPTATRCPPPAARSLPPRSLAHALFNVLLLLLAALLTWSFLPTPKRSTIARTNRPRPTQFPPAPQARLTPSTDPHAGAAQRAPPSAADREVAARAAQPQHEPPQPAARPPAHSEENGVLASENDAASPAIAASPADDRAPRPRRPLVEHINSIRDRVLEGKRRGEFGTPPDPKQMMDLANDEVRRLKEAGEIPAQLEIRFKITANAFFFEVPPTRTPPADRATRGEE